MEAYYYKITDVDDPKFIVDEGIIRYAEDLIFPLQNYGRSERYPDLPSECEAHHFKAKNCKFEGYYFDIPESVIKKYKLK